MRVLQRGVVEQAGRALHRHSELLALWAGSAVESISHQRYVLSNVADINYIVYRNLPQSPGSGHGLGPRCTPGQAQSPYRPTIGARLGPAWTGPEARASGPRAWPSTTLPVLPTEWELGG